MLDWFIESPAAATAAAFAFGLLFGSFLNVVILRFPRQLEWDWKQQARELLEIPATEEPRPPGFIVQRSHCYACKRELAAWENIPLLSWIALRGKCRTCKTPISAQYPLVELLMGLLCVFAVWQFGLGIEAFALIVFSGLLLALSGIDIHTTLLPDQLTYPLLWIGLLLSLGTVFVGPVDAILGALVGYLSLWSVYWAFKLLTGKEGMGHGDFKLLAALGAWMGYTAILPIVLISAVVGAIIGSLWLVIKSKDGATPIPFGPYLALAGLIWMYFGEQLMTAYLRFSGLAV